MNQLIFKRLELSKCEGWRIKFILNSGGPRPLKVWPVAFYVKPVKEGALLLFQAIQYGHHLKQYI